ncbi:hypothetical protein [Apibacter raozihei]|uniref:hypothetical protein n=1 Tax=Apibacter raozihei TaxID=2500547 RepID=UPI000FE37054|nr:hypothetical protein [Apibacter raozihei]
MHYCISTVEVLFDVSTVGFRSATSTPNLTFTSTPKTTFIPAPKSNPINSVSSFYFYLSSCFNSTWNKFSSSLYFNKTKFASQSKFAVFSTALIPSAFSLSYS